MKKTVYVVVVILVVLAGWIIWNSYKIMPSSPSTTAFVDSTYFKGEMSSTLGKYLGNKNGMTLYTFLNDISGVSTCTGACAAKWPAYGPGVSAKDVANLGTLPENVGTMVRADGTVQFTWKTKPVYTYAPDMKVGDTKGQAFGGVWYVVNL